MNNNTTTLRLRHEANITSYGTHHNGNCKPIIAVDLHKMFNSVTDAAEFFGVDPQRISNVLNDEGNHRIGLWERDENGNRIRRICMVRLTYAAHYESSMNAMMECGRESTLKLLKANQRIEFLEAENAQLRKEMAERQAQHDAELAHFRAWQKANKERYERNLLLEQAKAEEERIKNLVVQSEREMMELEMRCMYA